MNSRQTIVYISNLLLAAPLLAVVATVWQVNPELANSTVSGKYDWFYLSLATALVSTAIACLINRRRFKPQLIDGLVVLFCVSGMLISRLHGGLEHRHTLLLLLGVLFVLVRIHLSQWKPLHYCIIMVLLLAGCVEAIEGLRQLYGFAPSQHSLFKTTGSFFNPGPYAGFLALIAPLALYYCLRDYRVLSSTFIFRLTAFYLRWGLAICALFAIVLILPATMSRGAWLACLVACVFVALSYIKKKKKKACQGLLRQAGKKKRYLACLLLFLAVIAGGAGAYFLKKDSADGRLLMWKLSAKTLLHTPWGSGVGNYPGQYGKTQAAYFASGKASTQEEYVAGSPEYAFNEYLQIGIELGLIPLLLFLTIIGGSLVQGIRTGQAGIVGSLLSLLVFACVSYPFSVLPFLIVFVFLIALCHNKRISSFVSKKETALNVGCLALLALLTAFLLKEKPAVHAAYKKWKLTKYLYQAGAFSDAAREYNEMGKRLNHEAQFLFEYGRSLSKAGEHAQSNTVLHQAARINCDPMLYNIMGQNEQALGQYTEAERSFVYATQLIPERLYPHYLLMKLHKETGEQEKLKEAAHRVLTMEPKVHSKAVEEMREEAFEELKTKN